MDTAGADSTGKNDDDSYSRYVVVLILAFATLAIYGQTARHEFVGYDDDLLVTDNANVNQGITWDGVVAVFTTAQVANWLPLTMISHMLDVEFFGLRPMGHHLVGVAFHLVNAILLYALLVRMTGSVFRSALVPSRQCY